MQLNGRKKGALASAVHVRTVSYTHLDVNKRQEADYLNESNQTVIHKPDGGAPPKQLTNSYSNAYLDTNDTDQDGLFDFVRCV